MRIPPKGLAAAAGGASALAAGWFATHRIDRRAIDSDPKAGTLFAPFGGRRRTVSSADGTRLAVREFGPEDGPTIVLVHGWTCAAEFWKLQAEALAERFRVVAYDLRGHGSSGRATSGDYSIEAFGADLEAVLRSSVPAGERALVVGHSLGAMSIVSWAGEHPEKVEERVSAAILVNTGVGDLISRSLVVEGVPEVLARAQRLAGQSVLRARGPIPAISAPISHRVIRYAVTGPDASPAEVAFCERLAASCPSSVRAACGGTLSSLDLATALASLAVPTLIVAGECDRLTPPRHAEEMAAALPNVLDLVEVPRSGHMTPVEFPEATNALIADLAAEAGTVQAGAS